MDTKAPWQEASTSQKLVDEAIDTAFLLARVVGFVARAERLAGWNLAIWARPNRPARFPLGRTADGSFRDLWIPPARGLKFDYE